MRDAVLTGGNALPEDDPPDVTRFKAAAAKRVQAHRWRRRLGLRCLTVRVSDRTVRHLISTGYLSLESSEWRSRSPLRPGFTTMSPEQAGRRSLCPAGLWLASLGTPCAAQRDRICASKHIRSATKGGHAPNTHPHPATKNFAGSIRSVARGKIEHEISCHESQPIKGQRSEQHHRVVHCKAPCKLPPPLLFAPTAGQLRRDISKAPQWSLRLLRSNSKC